MIKAEHNKALKTVAAKSHRASYCMVSFSLRIQISNIYAQLTTPKNL